MDNPKRVRYARHYLTELSIALHANIDSSIFSALTLNLDGLFRNCPINTTSNEAIIEMLPDLESDEVTDDTLNDILSATW